MKIYLAVVYMEKFRGGLKFFYYDRSPVNGSSPYIGVLKDVNRELRNPVTSAEAVKETKKTQISLSLSVES